MKISELAKLIRTEVRQAVKEEVADIIREAIQIASTPEQHVTEKVKPVRELTTKVKPQKYSPLEQILEETRLSFTSADAKVFVSAEERHNLGNQVPNTATAMATKLGFTSSEDQVGVDLSTLPFIKNAKAVLDLAVEKDRQRYS
jgi:hypothetical protein